MDSKRREQTPWIDNKVKLDKLVDFMTQTQQSLPHYFAHIRNDTSIAKSFIYTYFQEKDSRYKLSCH